MDAQFERKVEKDNLSWTYIPAWEILCYPTFRKFLLPTIPWTMLVVA